MGTMPYPEKFSLSGIKQRRFVVIVPAPNCSKGQLEAPHDEIFAVRLADVLFLGHQPPI
jgi:hypothetical protein